MPLAISSRYRSYLSRASRATAILAGCLFVAAGAAVGLEQYLRTQWLSSGIAPPPSANASGVRFLSAEWMAARMPSRTDAPDFCLPRLSDGIEVRLSEHRGYRPVVLIFGSPG